MIVNTVTGQLFYMPRDSEPGLVHVLARNQGLLFFSLSAKDDLSIICASLVRICTRTQLLESLVSWLQQG